MFLAGHTVIVLLNVLAILYVITVVSICLMIVFENRNPVKTLVVAACHFVCTCCGTDHLRNIWPLLPQAEDLYPQKHD